MKAKAEEELHNSPSHIHSESTQWVGGSTTREIGWSTKCLLEEIVVEEAEEDEHEAQVVEVGALSASE